ncbi:hypothetical protein F1880_001269 [Penicillium rolfsii]|nr:hypothetical protein F1880_001269 [Penicillium rolfsii]
MIDGDGSIWFDVLPVAMLAVMERTWVEQDQKIDSLNMLPSMDMPTSGVIVAHPYESCDVALWYGLRWAHRGAKPVDGFASDIALGRHISVYDRDFRGQFDEIDSENPSVMRNSVCLQMSNTLLHTPHYQMKTAVYRIVVHVGRYGPSAILLMVPVTFAWRCLVGH